MIKARGSDAAGMPVYFLGLSKGNIEKLKKGDPILIDNNELGFSGTTIILYGETEETITAELAKHFTLPS